MQPDQHTGFSSRAGGNASPLISPGAEPGSLHLLFAGASGLTIGEALSRAKASVSDNDTRRTRILFGDPTTRLR